MKHRSFAAWAAALMMTISIAITPAAAALASEATDTTRGPEPRPVSVAAGNVVPGAVTTTAVELPALVGASGSDALRFSVEAFGDVRLLSPAEGSIAAEDAEDPIILVTYTVPKGQLSGPLTLARVTIDGPTGESWSADLAATVLVDARLELSLAASESDIAAGEVRDIAFTLTNLGNSADTVVVEIDGESGWSLQAAPEALAVAPGQRVMGTVRVRAPEDATPGDRLLLSLIARGRSVVARAQLVIGIVHPETAPNYALPIRVFTGASRGAAGESDLAASWAISGRGEVADGTTLSIDAHSPYRSGGGSVFARELTGPVFRATLERDRWQLTAGKIFRTDDLFTGGYLNGTGVSGSWNAGALRASATIAENDAIGLSSGRVANADISLGTAVGEIGLAFHGEERTARAGVGEELMRGGALTFRGGSSERLRARASAGLVEVSGPAGRSLSPTGFLDLNHSSDRGYFSLRARRTSAEATSFGARGSELFAGGSLELGRGIAATGWYADDVLSSALPGSAGRTRASSAGIRFPAGPVQAAVRGTTRSTTPAEPGSAAERRTAAAFDLSTVLGGAFATLTAEHELGSSDPVDFLQGSVQWQTGRSWTSLSGSYSAPGVIDPIVRLDLVQTLQFGDTRVDLAAGGTPSTSGLSNFGGWARVERDLNRNLSMVVGAEYSPVSAIGSPLRLSVGFTRALSVGLPTRRAAVVTGVAYHDLNGDGVRGDNEPGYAGLMLRRGHATATTTHAGGFELAGPVDALVSVDANSLQSGYIVPPAQLALTGSRMEIPIVQAGGLALELFVDADLDGARGGTEAPAAGVLVTLTHASGMSYTESSDEQGRIEFQAMLPGAYVALVEAGSGYAGAEIDLHIVGGRRTEGELPLRTAVREIRFGPASTTN